MSFKRTCYDGGLIKTYFLGPTIGLFFSQLYHNTHGYILQVSNGALYVVSSLSNPAEVKVFFWGF